jgi:transcriptional regulator with XRE-family HTH domain
MNRDPYTQLLQTLKTKRLSKNLTQAQVAAGIQLSRAQYTAIEQGRSMLNWKHLHRLAKFLKTSWTIRA